MTLQYGTTPHNGGAGPIEPGCGASSSRFEPSLSYVLLRACRHCGAPHPLASGRPCDPSICTDCGMPVQPASAPKTVAAVITGRSPAILIARLFLFIGAWLARFAKRN